ncbi:helix-turn-helix transcriptional regulator [Rhizobium sp. YIM 134829]|uniref:helix-turn-helix transcriptional regulator n=1 Tax=Rhizobium sp. YIM 134829 TaxID=3390453 RepID=UPI00397C0468
MHPHPLLADLSRRIDHAAMSGDGWGSVCAAIAEFFPGAGAMLFHEDPVADRVSGVVTAGLDPAAVQQFQRDFAHRNPWGAVWQATPEACSSISERDFPVRLLKRSAFYADFLRRYPELHAAAGIKISGSVDSRVRLAIHYPLRQAEAYDPQLHMLLTRLIRPFATALFELHTRQQRLDHQAAGLVLTGQAAEIALTVDDRMTVLDCTAPAERALSGGLLFGSRRGHLVFNDSRAQARIERAIHALSQASSLASETLFVDGEGERWRIALARLPALQISGLWPARPQVLVQCRPLHTVAAEGLDPAVLKELFRLTPAEQRLCRQLAQGGSVQDAAVTLGLATETARHRLKTIFRKTGTHRQAELLLLLRSL